MSVSKGDVVTVISSNLSRGYLVHGQTPPSEGWIPSYCLHLPGTYTKKPSAWAFKIRKPSSTKLGKQESSSNLVRGFLDHMNNVNITVGEQCVFTCRLSSECLHSCQLVWKGPGGGLLQPGGRVRCHTVDTSAGSTLATLTLDNCQMSDSGDYYCILANEDGSVSSSARLTVSCE